MVLRLVCFDDRLGLAVSHLILLASLVAPAAVGAETQRPDDWTLPNLDRSSTRAAAASPITPHTVARLHVLWRFRFAHSTVSPSGTRTRIAARCGGDADRCRQHGLRPGCHERRLRDRPHDGEASLGAPVRRPATSGETACPTAREASTRAPTRPCSPFRRRPVSCSGSDGWSAPFEQFIDIAPLIANNLVYVSTVGYPPGGRGAIYALDAHTGTIRWKFSTIRGPWRYPA